jgi:hypothetical protein
MRGDQHGRLAHQRDLLTKRHSLHLHPLKSRTREDRPNIRLIDEPSPRGARTADEDPARRPIGWRKRTMAGN